MARDRRGITQAWVTTATALGVLGCQVEIASGLTEQSANRVVVALAESGVEAAKARDPAGEGSFSVAVARADANDAIVTLSEAGLPRPTPPSLLDTLGEGSLVPSRSAEHARVIAGTASELERSLEGIDGVIAARVHLAVPTAAALGETPPTPRASVLLRHRGATPPIASGDVQRLVSGAVLGLLGESVAVVFTSTPQPPAPTEPALAHLGPVTTTRGSAGALKALIALSALCLLAMVGALVTLWIRGSRLRRQLSESLDEREAST